MKPFRKGDTHSTFSNHIEKITEEIKNLDNQYVISTSITELENFFVQKAIIEPLILHVEEYYIANQTGIPIDVSHDFDRFVFPGERAFVNGTSLEIAIPYEGDKELWELRASTFSLGGYPEIDIMGNRISFKVKFTDDSVDSSKIKKEIDDKVKGLSEAVRYIKNDVDSFNSSVLETITSALGKKVNQARSAIGAISSLGIPIAQRREPLSYVVPTIRKKNPVSKPVASIGRYEAEPVLDESEYQNILRILGSMSHVIERSPSSFATLDEEAIRTHFLLQLNGHYEGSATGETFNASGKTDILIREKDRNVFIAECKFWRGPKVFNDTIDQLLGYLTWRDTKCAILIFNRNKDTLSVRDKMHQVMESRSEHRRTVINSPDGDSRYILVKKSEPGRELIITTQIYSFPQNKDC